MTTTPQDLLGSLSSFLIRSFFSLNDLGIWCRSVRPTLRIPIPRSRVHSVHLGPQHVSFIRWKVFHYDNSLLFNHHHCCPYLSRSHQHMRYLDTHCLKARVIQLQGFLSFANVGQLLDVISLSMLKRKDTYIRFNSSTCIQFLICSQLQLYQVVGYVLLHLRRQHRDRTNCKTRMATSSQPTRPWLLRYSMQSIAHYYSDRLQPWHRTTMYHPPHPLWSL